MTPDYSKDTLPRMEAMLQHGRRRLVRAHVKARLGQSLRVLAGGVFVIGAVFMVLRVLGWAFGTPVPSGGYAVLATVVFAGVVLLKAIVNGRRGAASRADQVAERLDETQETHNRIATAIALLRSGDESPFARAAIQDGWETLARLKDEDPVVGREAVSWSRAGLGFIVGIALMVGGHLLIPKSDSLEDVEGQVAIVESQLDLPSETSATVKPQDGVQPEDVPAAGPGERSALPKKSIAESKNAERKEPGTGSRSEGKMGSHSAAESRSSQSVSKSSSAASGGGAKSKPSESEPGKPKKKPRESQRKVVNKPKPKEKAKQGGSINAQGASGVSSSATAQNEWASKVKAKADEGSDLPQEDEPDEEADPDNQRLGAQPALKNRVSRISRELSLMTGSETDNTQKRGRGGPGGQKKSRGTATMIMGVPVPGFVRGRLLPGPTKSTQEEVEPSPRESEYASASNLPQGRPEEGAQERFRPAATIAEQARDYLIQSHAEHENRRNEDKAGK